MPTSSQIAWTEYSRNRAELRELDLIVLEEILRHGTERYQDLESAVWW